MDKKYIFGAVAVIVVLWIGLTWGKRDVKAPEGMTSVDMSEQEVATVAPKASNTNKVVNSSIASEEVSNSVPLRLSDGSYLVTYTNFGFSPTSITIKKGESVRFVNHSDKAMSLMTTEPNSQIFGEFNQAKSSLGLGGIYDFTFLSAGDWEYTNRNNNTDIGLIVVE